MLEVDHARQLLAECNMPEAACQLDALLETAAAKDTICQWQMLLNVNAAQGAANPSPLRRRNGPQLRHKRPPTSLKRRAPAYALATGPPRSRALVPWTRADRKPGGREGRDCGSPLRRVRRTTGVTVRDTAFSVNILRIIYGPRNQTKIQENLCMER